MRWVYIGFGALGAVTAFLFMMDRTFAYFHNIAEAIGRVDVEFNVLVVVGGAMGVMMIPVGVGLGLIVATIINLVMVRAHLGPYSRSNDTSDGTSWVTHRDRVGKSSGSASSHLCNVVTSLLASIPPVACSMSRTAFPKSWIVR